MLDGKRIQVQAVVLKLHIRLFFLWICFCASLQAGKLGAGEGFPETRGTIFQLKNAMCNKPRITPDLGSLIGWNSQPTFGPQVPRRFACDSLLSFKTSRTC
jgi:hypothetical protein